jgi:hypothetical protein
MRYAVLVAVVVLAAPAIGEDKPAIKEIATKDLKLVIPETGKVTQPAEIKTAEELAKSPVVGKEADTVKKQIDFSKEKLVVFAWSGSGGDRVAGGLNKDGKTAEFTYTGGLTFDLRQHSRLYVVPKDATVKVIIAK